MIISNLEKINFDETISKGVVLLDFYASWCGPCKMLAPELEALCKKMEDLTIIKIDVDKYGDLARKYGVMTIPTLVLYKDGKELKKLIGYMPLNDIEEWIMGA